MWLYLALGENEQKPSSGQNERHGKGQGVETINLLLLFNVVVLVIRKVPKSTKMITQVCRGQDGNEIGVESTLSNGSTGYNVGGIVFDRRLSKLLTTTLWFLLSFFGMTVIAPKSGKQKVIKIAFDR